MAENALIVSLVRLQSPPELDGASNFNHPAKRDYRCRIAVRHHAAQTHVWVGRLFTDKPNRLTKDTHAFTTALLLELEQIETLLAKNVQYDNPPTIASCA